jgi:hypothetical protein
MTAAVLTRTPRLCVQRALLVVTSVNMTGVPAASGRFLVSASASVLEGFHYVVMLKSPANDIPLTLPHTQSDPVLRDFSRGNLKQ